MAHEGTHESTKKPAVLAACAPAAIQTLRRILDEDVDLVAVSSIGAVQYELTTNPRIALIICGVHFDHERMHDLLLYVRRIYASIPIVSCRILESDIPKASREAIETLARTSPGSFLDLPALIHQQGQEEAEQCFREAVLARARERTR